MTYIFENGKRTSVLAQAFANHSDDALKEIRDNATKVIQLERSLLHRNERVLLEAFTNRATICTEIQRRRMAAIRKRRRNVRHEENT